LALFKNIPFQSFGDSDPIRATALIRVKIGSGERHLLFFPKGGGVQIQFEGRTVQIVTPSSSLGQSLLGLSAGDVVDFESGGRVSECEVLEVL
jgi:hypothetical protein